MICFTSGIISSRDNSNEWPFQVMIGALVQSSILMFLIVWGVQRTGNSRIFPKLSLSRHEALGFWHMLVIQKTDM